MRRNPISPIFSRARIRTETAPPNPPRIMRRRMGWARASSSEKRSTRPGPESDGERMPIQTLLVGPSAG